MSNQILPIQNNYLESAKGRDYLGAANSLVLDKVYSYIADSQLVLLQTVNKHWKKECWAYFGREASKMTQAGVHTTVEKVPMTADEVAKMRICSMEEIVQKIKQCASRLPIGKNGIFTCKFPLDWLDPLVFTNDHSDENSVKFNYVAVGKDIKGVNPKISITTKSGIKKEISFCEAIGMNSHIPVVDLPMDEVAKCLSKLEDLISYFGPRLKEIIGQELGEQAERIVAKGLDKSPEHLILNRQSAIILLKIIPLIEQNKALFDQVVNDSIGLLSQVAETPAVKTAITTVFNNLESSEEPVTININEIPARLAFSFDAHIRELATQVDPELQGQVKELMAANMALLAPIFVPAFGMLKTPNDWDSPLVKNLKEFIYNWLTQTNPALNPPAECKTE